MTSNTINVYANRSAWLGSVPLDTVARPDRSGTAAPTGGRAESRIASDQRAMCSGNRQICANSSASRLAPPTRAPSMSGWAMIAAMLAALTEPPYRMRTCVGGVLRRSVSASRSRIAPMTSWASSGVAVLPVPIAQTGSYATTTLLDLLGGEPVQAPSSWAQRVRARASPASRISRPSPTQRIGVMLVGQRRLHLGVDQRVVLVVVLPALGVPDHHVRAAQLGQHRAGDLAGVRAGRRAGRGPARRTRSAACRRRPAVCTLRMSVNGGSTTTSTSVSCFSVRLNASFCTSGMASRWLRFIFQLPAISGRRVRARHVSVSSAARPGRVLPSRYSSEAPPPVEMCPNAASSMPERAHRRRRVAAADDA